MRRLAAWWRRSSGAPSCTLSILVARTDVRFLEATIPHLVRACGFPFRRRVLMLDSAPLGPAYAGRPGTGSLDELRAACRRLVAAGVVDEARDIDYSDATRERVYRRHFDRPVRQTHNHRGYPILGSMLAIEDDDSDYLVHFDSDLLLHQAPGHDWISDGIRLLGEDAAVAAVLPLCGPPSPDGRLLQVEEDGEACALDPRGFYRFPTFTSRIFLVDRRRFLDELLPLHPPGSDAELLGGESRLPPWEDMVGARLAATGHWRVDLASPRAWNLHAPDHGPAFVAALPELIAAIEAGRFPASQAGRYDLDLASWQGLPAGAGG